MIGGSITKLDIRWRNWSWWGSNYILKIVVKLDTNPQKGLVRW